MSDYDTTSCNGPNSKRSCCAGAPAMRSIGTIWPRRSRTSGGAGLRAVESHLVQALLYDLKAEAWLLSRDVPHWRADARGQRDDARSAFTPSMRQRLDVTELSAGRCAGCPT